MKRIGAVLGALLLLLSGCIPKDNNITFTAFIESVNENSILVIDVSANSGFDKASVDITEAKYDFDLKAGQKVEVTIKPEIRESYPVQATGVRIRLITQEDAGAGAAEYKKITAKEAKMLIDSGNVTVLDVRTQAEFASGHINGAILLPNTEIKKKAPEVLPDKNTTILVYCRSGNRSAQAAKILVEMGYTKVYDFGGIIDWPYEVVK